MINKKIQQVVLESLQNFLNGNFISPCVVYDFGLLETVLDEFKNQIPVTFNYQLFYAVKANSNEKILEFLVDKIDGVDVASLSELDVAKKFFPPTQISVNGPAFSYETLYNLIKKQYKVDINFLEHLQQFSPKESVGIRVTEPDELNNRMSRFGINICSDNWTSNLQNPLITRLHFHFGEKDDKFIVKLDKILFKLQEINKLREVREINLGGGFMKLFMENRLKEFFLSLMEIYKKYDIDSTVTTIIEPGSAITSFSAYMITSPVNVSEVNEQ
ncbi:pyridoxal-dependent decarboxylase [Streptococcus pneumoniae]|nr:pyridoxal-dependent decarboxylase [Streptococcus pneumoniae]